MYVGIYIYTYIYIHTYIYIYIYIYICMSVFIYVCLHRCTSLHVSIYPANYLPTCRCICRDVKYTFTSQRVSLKLLVPSLTFHCLVCNVGLTQLVSLAMRISSDEHTFHDDDLDSRTPPARQISGHLLLLPPRSLICRQVQPAQFEGRCLTCFVQLCKGNSG